MMAFSSIIQWISITDFFMTILVSAIAEQKVEKNKQNIFMYIFARQANKKCELTNFFFNSKSVNNQMTMTKVLFCVKHQ